MVEILRQKSPAERLAMVDGFWRSARDMIRNLVRSENPDWPDDRVMREVAKRLSHGAV